MHERTTATRVHGIIVTYRRPKHLHDLLERLATQQRRLDSLIVIDNDPDPANEATVAEFSRRVTPAVYVAAPDNLGPTGGIALGMRHVLERANDDDWLILFDDDNHDLVPRELDDLISFAEAAAEKDPKTAGVGQRGGRFSLTRARVHMVPFPAEPPVDLVPVDHLAGNGMPTYRVGAIRAVGPFAGEFFFGFGELEFGLRMRRNGYSLYKAGRPAGPTPPPKQEQRFRVIATDPPGWRRYYSLRNMIVILRRNDHPVTAARITVTRGVLKPLASLPFAPRNAARHLRLNLTAVRDAWSGRDGRRVEPNSDDYGPPSRSAPTGTPGDGPAGTA